MGSYGKNSRGGATIPWYAVKPVTLGDDNLNYCFRFSATDFLYLVQNDGIIKII